MGLMDKILSQFIEVIEWTDQTNDTLVYRFPVYSKCQRSRSSRANTRSD